MIAPFLLFLTSLAGIAAALTLPGLTDLLLLALPCAVASLYLLVLAYLRRNQRQTFDRLQRGPVPPKRGLWSRPAKRWILIDGSNVLHWKDGTPQLDTLREVVHHLTALGFTPGVVFDANAGYKIGTRYQHHFAMARHLGLPEAQVMVAPKGSPADPILLAVARDHHARIVTNDRYRDWTEAHPEVLATGHLIRGGFRDGKLWLDMD